MAKFIMLTHQQADEVRGKYPINESYDLFAELDPIQIKTGEWVLPVEVLTDPLKPFETKRELLESLPVKEIESTDF